MRCLLVQHAPWEGPGVHLLAAAKRSGAQLTVWRAWEEPQPPEARAFDALIGLGGPPNVDEEERFPYLAPLKGLLRSWVTARRPYLGFCLGHQLLAHVLGCQVGPQRRSVGFADAQLTGEGRGHPIFAGWPERVRLFKWHGQGVRPPLPGGLQLLAASEACPVEAISCAGAPQVVGMQFDLHAATESDARRWLAADRDWLAQTGPLADPVDGEAIIREARAVEAESGRLFAILWENFCGLVARGR